MDGGHGGPAVGLGAPDHAVINRGDPGEWLRRSIVMSKTSGGVRRG